MITKRVKKKIVGLCGAACLSLSILAAPGLSLAAQAYSEPGFVQPLSDKIEWRFKIENNKLYKRLFNYSTADWVGDWIYVRDL